MATWLVERVNCDPGGPSAAADAPRLRIFPEGEPDRWIAETNPRLPLRAQEEAAVMIADALSKALDG